MKLTTTVLSTTLLLISAAAYGEDAGADRIDALEKSLKSLTDQVKKLKDEAVTPDDVQGVNNALENFKYQVQRDRETKTAVPAGRGQGGAASPGTNALIVGGLVQVRYEAANRVTNTGAAGGGASTVPTVSNNASFTDDRQNTFDVGSVQFFFQGNLFRDYGEGRNLTYNLRFGTSPQTGTVNNFANVLDANVVYSPFATTSQDIDRLTVTFGQQTLPFGLEANTTDELRPTISSALFLGPSLLGRREVGLIIRGDTGITYDYGYNYRSSLISYNLGIVNGNGPNRGDDNNYKDIIGRVDFKLPTDYNSWLRELRVGFSGYYGRQNLTGGPAAAPTFTTGQQGDKNRYGVDVYYNHYPFGVTYEYLRLIDDTVLGATLATSSIYKRLGDSHTATFFYSFGEQFLGSQRNQGRFDDFWPKTWQPFARYDHFDPDRNAARNETDIWTLGLNVFFAETTKVQLNVNRRVDHFPNREDLHTYEGLAQLQYGF